MDDTCDLFMPMRLIFHFEDISMQPISKYQLQIVRCEIAPKTWGLCVPYKMRSKAALRIYCNCKMTKAE